MFVTSYLCYLNRKKNQQVLYILSSNQHYSQHNQGPFIKNSANSKLKWKINLPPEQNGRYIEIPWNCGGLHSWPVTIDIKEAAKTRATVAGFIFATQPTKN